MVGPPDTTPPTTTATLAGTLGSNGWYKAGEPVRLTLTATDAGSGVASTSYVVNGGAKQTYSGPVIFTDGVYTVTYYSTDKAGNVETTKAISFKVDQTPPSFSARGASPDQLWPLNHQMVDVTTPVAVADGGSGLAGFVLKSATSSEPDNGLGDGDTPNDIQGFEVGKPDTQGQLRAERSGRGSGRIYTLTYEGLDTAGNAQTCTAAATVPHDQGPITPGKPVRPLASPTVLPLVSPTIPAPRQQSQPAPRQSDSPPAGPSLRLVAVGPEQGSQGLAAVGSIGDGEVDQQGERLAQVQLDRPAVALDAGRAEDEQLLGRRRRPLSFLSALSVAPAEHRRKSGCRPGVWLACDTAGECPPACARRPIPRDRGPGGRPQRIRLTYRCCSSGLRRRGGGAGRSGLPARLARANPAPDAERAGALQRESLALRQAIDDAVGVGRCLDGLGWVATAQGQLARSARLFGAAEALRERLGAGPHPPWRAEHEQRVAATRAGLGEAAFAEAWTEGRAPVPVD